MPPTNTSRWISIALAISYSCIPLCGSSQEAGRRDSGFGQRFQQLDRDSNGKLSPDELLRMPRLAQGLSSANADRDGDGMFTRDEIHAYLTSVFVSGSIYQKEHTLTVDDRTRSYIIQVPKDARGKLPVVFFFHGGGGSSRNMTNIFRGMVAEEKFLAVYPQGWKNNWNDGRKARRIPAQVENVDDVKFVRHIVDELAEQHAIDRSRIFASGPSNGGIFSHYLAAQAADLFAGIAPVIGGLAEPVAADFKPSHPISLLVIQGDSDRFVPIDGGPIMGSLRRGRVIATEEMLSKYLAHNGITGQPQVTPLPDKDPDDGTTTTVHRYPPGTDGVRVEYYRIKGGGHTMPGNRHGVGLEGLVGKTSRDFDAAETIWKFFKSCPPRQPTP